MTEVRHLEYGDVLKEQLMCHNTATILHPIDFHGGDVDRHHW